LRKKTLFAESLIKNVNTYRYYVDMFTQIAISSWKYTNLPLSVNPRYLEITLFEQGIAVWFVDDVMGDMLALGVMPSSTFNVYGEYTERIAYSRYNDYTNHLTSKNSVLMYNNMLRIPDQRHIFEFASRLYNLDRAIDVNANAQKTPVLIKCPEKQRLTMVNVYKEYDGNAPVIFGNKEFDMNTLSVLKTDAPYVADRLYELKTKIFNECLTYLGIANVAQQKKERMVSDEVNRALGGVMANRNSRLYERQYAVQRVNDMFGTNITVEFNDGILSDMQSDGEEDIENE